MKRVSLIVALSGMFLMGAYQVQAIPAQNTDTQDTNGQKAKQDTKDAGHDTKDAAKSAGSAVKHGSKKAANEGAKGVNKGAQKTQEGAGKVEHKTADNDK